MDLQETGFGAARRHKALMTIVERALTRWIQGRGSDVVRGFRVLAWASLVITACQTGSGGAKPDEELKPPHVTSQTKPEEAASWAITYGGPTLEEVKRLAKKRHQGLAIGQAAEATLKKDASRLGERNLLNAGHLYAVMPLPLDLNLFSDLLASDRPLERHVGWQLAAAKPSPAVAQAIDRELTRAVADNEIEAALTPMMANAVQANRLRSAYTLVRQGLMAKGDEEFALAMMGLEPVRASDDFMDYLAQATGEELRQLTLSSVNLYTAVAIFKHLQRVPPSLGNPHFDHLFLYAVSRNTGLAELAQNVLLNYVPAHTDLVAMALAKHPAWVQIAYLENARRRMNPKQGLLLGELKKVTAERDVVEEIDESRVTLPAP